jgi:hypothetical protein
VAFKENADFLRFLTMGAAGTRAVHRDLEAQDHQVSELERYSESNKIWATKIKRLRLPDLFCLRCGLRVEAKAKSDLRIRLSDSGAVGRAWDAAMRPQDLVAFLSLRLTGAAGVWTGPTQYFSVDALRESVHRSKLGPRKSASEGAEQDRTWPARAPSSTGAVVAVTDGRVTMRWEAGRSYTYPAGELPWYVYVSVGDMVTAGDRFLSGAVQMAGATRCTGSNWDPAVDLAAGDVVDRYAAVKACGLLGEPVDEVLLTIASEDPEVRVRLEALGSLARLGHGEAVDQLAGHARGQLADGLSLEAVFLLTEVGTEGAVAALHALALDKEVAPDIRMAAVWGLGDAGARRGDLVLGFIDDESDDVALHAIAGVSAVGEDDLRHLRDMLEGGGREAVSAAQVLLRLGDVGLSVLADVLGQDGLGSERAVRALGSAGRAAAEPKVAAAPERAQALLEVLWRDHEEDWLRGVASLGGMPAWGSAHDLPCPLPRVA